MWPNSGFLARLPISIAAGLPRIMLWRASIGRKTRETGRPDDHVRCQYCGECKPDARPAAAVGRRLYLRTVSAGREPAADRSRYDVADHRRAVDPGTSRGTRDRRLFLHHARPAVDFDAVAGAGRVREGLCGRRLERS